MLCIDFSSWKNPFEWVFVCLGPFDIIVLHVFAYACKLLCRAYAIWLSSQKKSCEQETKKSNAGIKMFDSIHHQSRSTAIEINESCFLPKQYHKGHHKGKAISLICFSYKYMYNCCIQQR